MVQAVRRFDETGHARSGKGVADIGFNTTEGSRWHFRVSLVNGRYPIWIGLYDPSTFARLPIHVNGELQPDGVYQVGEIDINSAD